MPDGLARCGAAGRWPKTLRVREGDSRNCPPVSHESALSSSAALTCDNEPMSSDQRGSAISKPLATLLIVCGAIGLFAAFELATEYMKTLKDPTYVPNCAVNVLVTCGPNMGSWQGSLFGFSNTIIGLIAFGFPIAVGMSVFAGARFSAWYWRLFNLGMLGGYVFITWLYSESIFSLGTLCPWCMVVWAVTIPSFWYTTAWNLREGHYGRALRGFGQHLYDWAWVITALNYLLVAVLAQVRLEWLQLLL